MIRSATVHIFTMGSEKRTLLECFVAFRAGKLARGVWISVWRRFGVTEGIKYLVTSENTMVEKRFATFGALKRSFFRLVAKRVLSRGPREFLFFVPSFVGAEGRVGHKSTATFCAVKCSFAWLFLLVFFKHGGHSQFCFCYGFVILGMNSFVKIQSSDHREAPVTLFAFVFQIGRTRVLQGAFMCWDFHVKLHVVHFLLNISTYCNTLGAFQSSIHVIFRQSSTGIIFRGFCLARNRLTVSFNAKFLMSPKRNLVVEMCEARPTLQILQRRWRASSLVPVALHVELECFGPGKQLPAVGTAVRVLFQLLHLMLEGLNRRWEQLVVVHDLVSQEAREKTK